MKVSLDQEKDKTNLLPRKKRRQLERKLIKAKRNAWHHRQKVSHFIFCIFLRNKNLI